MENDIRDTLFVYDKSDHDSQVRAKPWVSDLKYFKKVKISTLALVKMNMHAKSGGDIEVMGLMVGKIQGDTMVVTDSFALPVEGTETRVNAAQEGYEYMVSFMENLKSVGREENVIGKEKVYSGYSPKRLVSFTSRIRMLVVWDW